jgi:hypothetical protein
METPTNHLTQREAWLNAMLPFIREHFKSFGFEAPENVRYSCGFPSKSALGRKKLRIGEVWDAECTDDKHFLIFVSPLIGCPVKAVGVQIHEIVHAVVGLKHGHKKPFARCAGMVGLTKPWTATGESDALVATIKSWVEKVGPYPHGALTPRMAEKADKGRLLLLECECGLKIRSTQKWIDEYGTEWPCPCGERLRVA